jgi:hypothetical protein
MAKTSMDVIKGRASCATPLDSQLALALVHVPGLAADEGFVGFNLALELLETPGLHRQADAVEHEPCGLPARTPI